MCAIGKAPVQAHLKDPKPRASGRCIRQRGGEQISVRKNYIYLKMKEEANIDNLSVGWYAIRTHDDFKAADVLKMHCNEVFFPTRSVKKPGRKPRLRAAIPHVLFVRTTPAHALELETLSRTHVKFPFSFWIYRFPNDPTIRRIPETSIRLLRMLTAESDEERCEIFNKANYKAGQRVRITDGLYNGYEGFVQRVRKNRHVVVRIEGLCLVLLPYIHPDLLQPLD